MSKATLYNYSITGTSVIDELYQDVGTSTFQLGTVKRAFAGGSEFSISPGDAASHYLVEGVDYELVDEDFNYTEECGFAVYTGVRILNSDYQTGDLYISYTCIGSYTDVSTILAAIANSGLTVKNLVYNSDFTFYSNQTATANWYDYKHPDGWIFTCDGTSPQIGYDSSAVACRITTPADATAMSLVQNLHEFPRWAAKLRGKQVTVHVSIQGPAGVSVTLTDGVTSDSETLEGTGSAESIDLTLTVDAAATYLRLTIASTGNTETIYLYAAYGNIGEVAIEGLPCQIDRIGLWQGMDDAYPETVMECSAVSSLIEIPAGYTRLESWLNGRFGRGANSRSYLPELRGRFLRVWAHGSTQDPDRATRTNRGDGTTGDKVGTLQANQNLSHNHYYVHISAGWAGDNNSGGIHESIIGDYTGSSGGNQSNPNNINVLAGIRWA